MEYVLIAVVAWIAFAWAIKGTAMLLFKLFPSLRPDPEVQRQRWLARKEAKARKKKAASPSKKKRGPIGGSHTAEIMMLGEDPVNRWAARKVRDKFF